MADIIQLRRDTSTNWTTANPILADGEIGFETNTKKFKFGDAITAWNSLLYASVTADVAASIVAAAAKTTPVDADQFGITDSAAGNILKKLTWANIKTALASIFEPVFSKGNLIQGTNVTLTGTLANRLVGTGDVTIAASGGDVGAQIGAATIKTTIVNADSFGVIDSEAGSVLKRISFETIKNTIGSGAGVSLQSITNTATTRIDNLSLNADTSIVYLTGLCGSISGINAGGINRKIVFVNNSGDFINFDNDSVNSSVGNRFGFSFGMASGIAVEVVYLADFGKWLKIG